MALPSLRRGSGGRSASFRTTVSRFLRASTSSSASSAFANLVAGYLVTRDSLTGRLEGYGRAGYLTVGAFLLAVVLAHRLRAAATHAARPAAPIDLA